EGAGLRFDLERLRGLSAATSSVAAADDADVVFLVFLDAAVTSGLRSSTRSEEVGCVFAEGAPAVDELSSSSSSGSTIFLGTLRALGGILAASAVGGLGMESFVFLVLD